MDKLSQNPALQDLIDSSVQVYDPEIVFTYNYKPDADGWARIA